MEWKVEFVGVAANMPGTTGFTIAAFKADEVPPGTRLYTKPPVRHEGSWNTGEPNIPSRTGKEFIVAVHRQGVPGLPYVFAAFYSNEFQISREGEFLRRGWYVKGIDAKYYPLLKIGDVLRGWMELPVFEE
jgi:hypothetical protein